MLRHLDGKHDRSAIVAALEEAVANDAFTIQQGDETVRDPEQVANMLVEGVESSLERMVRLGLLHGEIEGIREMTDTLSDAFLNGQGIPVDPHEIETELTRLWGPAAERVGGPAPENPNVTRIVLANLVVAGRHGRRAPARRRARHGDGALSRAGRS